MTRLESLQYEVNCAALAAIDAKLSEITGIERKAWITDAMLPRILPAIEAATIEALRGVYDLYPESLMLTDAQAARVREQLNDSLARIHSLKRQEERR